MDRSPRPHRPVPYADLTAIIDAAGGVTADSRAELASATAAAVVRAGRDADRPGGAFVGLADRVGLDTLAALWHGSDPVSLPGALWAVYVLRQWLRGEHPGDGGFGADGSGADGSGVDAVNGAGEDVERIWRAGAPLAPADAVVAGVGDAADGPDLAGAADAIVSGVYRGELDVALERAAAVFRVMAAGRREIAGHAADGPDGPGTLADRNQRAAEDLTTAARRWRDGTLT